MMRGGRFSITHPSFLMRLWTRDESGNKLWKPADDHLTIRADVSDFRGPTRRCHRPLSRCSGALMSASFLADALREPTPGSEPSPELDHVWRIPDFVVIRALP
jgi:hypothetical protein